MSISNVYLMRVDVTACVTAGFNIDNDPDFWYEHFQTHLRGKPLPEDWRMPPVELGAEDKPLHDFVWAPEAPIVSNKAREALECIVGDGVQFWPIGKIQEKDYFIFNVIRVLDCIDLRKSDILFATDEPGKILYICKAMFNLGNIPPATTIFKVPQDARDIYVTKSFIECVREHRLTGVGFEHPDNPGYGGPRYAFKDLPIRGAKLN